SFHYTRGEGETEGIEAHLCRRRKQRLQLSTSRRGTRGNEHLGSMSRRLRAERDNSSGSGENLADRGRQYWCVSRSVTSRQGCGFVIHGCLGQHGRRGFEGEENERFQRLPDQQRSSEGGQERCKCHALPPGSQGS